MLKKIWNKLFGKGPLYRDTEIEFMGQKALVQTYSKKRLAEAIEAAPHGSIMFISASTYIMIAHLSQEIPESTYNCRGDCANCELLDLEEEDDGSDCR